MDLFNMLTIDQQIKFYKSWCKDNNKEAKSFQSLNAYFNEIQGRNNND